MSLREIKKYPERVLKEIAAPVETIDSDILKLIDDMIETMHAAPGIGLAAPQVGVSRRVIVIDISHCSEEETPLLVLINPEIIYAEGEITGEEGCLSLPGYTTNITRSEKVTVLGLDRKGTPVKTEAEGLLAISLQHEIDHLNGILIIDKISSLKREFFKKRLKKALARD